MEKAACMRQLPDTHPHTTPRRTHKHGDAAASRSPRTPSASRSAAGVFGGAAAATASQLATVDDDFCMVCGNDEVSNANSIVFCDLCDVAVHQVFWGWG
jgi:hypothetical protein